MRTLNRIETFEDSEQKGQYFVLGAKDFQDAYKWLCNDYPETKELFNVSNGHIAFMRKCLDCKSYWVSDDVCGECGEYRLSKRLKQSYNFK